MVAMNQKMNFNETNERFSVTIVLQKLIVTLKSKIKSVKNDIQNPNTLKTPINSHFSLIMNGCMNTHFRKTNVKNF